MPTMQRLAKILAHRGAWSRREADILCRRGRVTVDEVVVRDSSKRVNLTADIRVNGEAVVEPPTFAMYHKPEGVHSTMRDNHERADLSTVLPEAWRGVLHPVGRLDANTTGLLLFCKDGALTQWLLHPRRAIEREYIARVAPAPDAEALTARLAAGVETSEGVVCAEVVAVEDDRVRLIVREGKYHMVRRILANAGHPVQELHRLRYGQCTLGDLPVGALRALSEEEFAWILEKRTSSNQPTIR